MSLETQNRTVFTNGCFDILHRGHFELFRYARGHGDFLIVAIDSDIKVKKDKGHSRPHNTAEDRKFALESIKYIDEVIVFDTREQLEQIVEDIRPDIMIVGSDWEGKPVIGEQFAKQLKFFKRIGDYSTTNILGAII
tara:strand:+ start:908 stop:1318 length:411 start_codon:yes stop_codon:yes gene_type:complete